RAGRGRRRCRPRPGHRALDRRPARWRDPPRTPSTAGMPHGRDPARSLTTPRGARAPMSLAPIDEALRRIRRGEMVLVVDDEDRENRAALQRAAHGLQPEA